MMGFHGGFGGGPGGGPGGPGGMLRHAMDDELIGKAYDQKIMSRLLHYLAPHWKMMALAVLAASATAVSSLAGPYLIKIAIDQFIVVRDPAGLTFIVALYIANTIANWLLNYGQIYSMSWVGQRVLYTLRVQMFQHLMRQSQAFYDRNEVGRTMSRVQNDVNVLNELLTTGLVSVFTDFLSLFVIVGIMFTMNAQLSLVTLVVIPMIFVTLLIWQNRARRAYRSVRVAISAVNAGLQENISGVRVVQSMVREEENLQQFDERNTAHLDANVHAGRLHAILLPAMDIISSIATALVIGFGGALALSGELTEGALVAFTLYVSRFFDPIRDLSERYNQLQSAMTAGERIFELLDTEPAVQDAEDAVELSTIRGEVRFDAVSFEYEPGVPVLQEVDFTTQPGQTMALVGPTGAGKSTIANLLARFYDVTGGAIYVDGVDLRTMSIKSLRRQIGIVAQDPFLFSGTIRENIMYGNLDATEEQMLAAAGAAGVDEMIERMDQGYDTQVQERGGRLSLGQRQLISFARAILADPRILILDEATSNVDTYTEAIIQRALRHLLQGRTSFIIAHRLSTIRNADRILVIDQGRILEEGRHDDLLAAGGLYSQLYSKGLLGIVEEGKQKTAAPTM